MLCFMRGPLAPALRRGAEHDTTTPNSTGGRLGYFRVLPMDAYRGACFLMVLFGVAAHTAAHSRIASDQKRATPRSARISESETASIVPVLVPDPHRTENAVQKFHTDTRI